MPSAFAPLFSPLGFFHEGAGRSFAYSAEIVKQLHRDINAGRATHRTAEGLYVMGVRQVVFRDRYQWFTPALALSDDFALRDGVLTTVHATPLLASRRAVAAAALPGLPDDAIIRERRYLEPETFDYSGRYYRELVAPLLDRMGVDMAHGTAAALVSRDPAFTFESVHDDAPRVDVATFTADLKRVSVRYTADREAAGQLPYTLFPVPAGHGGRRGGAVLPLGDEHDPAAAAGRYPHDRHSRRRAAAAGGDAVAVARRSPRHDPAARTRVRRADGRPSLFRPPIMNILVTGAAGYIGSVVTERLVDEGHTVVALDNLRARAPRGRAPRRPLRRGRSARPRLAATRSCGADASTPWCTWPPRRSSTSRSATLGCSSGPT